MALLNIKHKHDYINAVCGLKHELAGYNVKSYQKKLLFLCNSIIRIECLGGQKTARDKGEN